MSNNNNNNENEAKVKISLQINCSPPSEEKAKNMRDEISRMFNINPNEIDLYIKCDICYKKIEDKSSIISEKCDKGHNYDFCKIHDKPEKCPFC
jgi:hypothetical protein